MKLYDPESKSLRKNFFKILKVFQKFEQRNYKVYLYVKVKIIQWVKSSNYIRKKTYSVLQFLVLRDQVFLCRTGRRQFIF